MTASARGRVTRTWPRLAAALIAALLAISCAAERRVHVAALGSSEGAPLMRISVAGDDAARRDTFQEFCRRLGERASDPPPALKVPWRAIQTNHQTQWVTLDYLDPELFPRLERRRRVHVQLARDSVFGGGAVIFLGRVRQDEQSGETLVLDGSDLRGELRDVRDDLVTLARGAAQGLQITVN